MKYCLTIFFFVVHDHMRTKIKPVYNALFPKEGPSFERCIKSFEMSTVRLIFRF